MYIFIKRGGLKNRNLQLSQNIEINYIKNYIYELFVNFTM